MQKQHQCINNVMQKLISYLVENHCYLWYQQVEKRMSKSMMKRREERRTAGGNRKSSLASRKLSSRGKEKSRIKSLLSRIAVQPQEAQWQWCLTVPPLHHAHISWLWHMVGHPLLFSCMHATVLDSMLSSRLPLK